MDTHSTGRWQHDGEWLCTPSIKEDANWELTYPSGSAFGLTGGTINRSTLPSRPINGQIASARKVAVLIGEDQYVVPKHNEQVAEFLPKAIARFASIVEEGWEAPEAQKRVSTDAEKFPLRFVDP